MELKLPRYYINQIFSDAPNCTLVELKLPTKKDKGEEKKTPNCTLVELKLLISTPKPLNTDSPNCTLVELKLQKKQLALEKAIASKLYLSGIEIAELKRLVLWIFRLQIVP